ncbi:unnamed protein product [Brassica oleracea]
MFIVSHYNHSSNRRESERTQKISSSHLLLLTLLAIVSHSSSKLPL